VSGEAPAGDAAESPAAHLPGLRVRLGLSQEQLARQLGASFATVNRWDRSHSDVGARRPRAGRVRGPPSRRTWTAVQSRATWTIRRKR